ncbi:heparinase, partial [Pseudoalteromonas sp. Isolate6]|uniref:heparinase II/III family protein n=1 Tax=Pseudoalteromonas sp. Isolate6 TaxID=2908527 RepID=UPI0023D7E8AB
IKYIVRDDKTDVKNVWELSRLQHLVTVSKAYVITLDEKFYKFVRESIVSWITSNPYGYSVNWTCNMEVAIRVVNVILCYELLKERIYKDNEFEIIIKTMVYYHCKHISENLENYSELRNNHYLANLMGLLISSKFLEEKNKSYYEKLQKFAKFEMQNEIDKQIYDDGVTYEVSTGYQKLVYEILLFSIVLGETEENKFDIKYIHKLYDM